MLRNARKPFKEMQAAGSIGRKVKHLYGGLGIIA